MKTSLSRILNCLAVAAVSLTCGGIQLASAKPANHAPVQKVTIDLPAGYKAGAATVKAGQRVALTFHLKSEAGCGDQVSVPDAKWKKGLKVGQSATVEYTPTKSGVLHFSCGMGMYQGTIIVK